MNALRIFIVLVVSLSVPVVASASVWYDKLPTSGEYVPINDERVTPPLDFLERVNVAPPYREESSTAAEDQTPPVFETLDKSNSNSAANEADLPGALPAHYLLWAVGVVFILLSILFVRKFFSGRRK